MSLRVIASLSEIFQKSMSVFTSFYVQGMLDAKSNIGVGLFNRFSQLSGHVAANEVDRSNSLSEISI